MSTELQAAKSEAFARLLVKLLEGHVDSYTGSPGFMSATEPEEVPPDNPFVQLQITMPDGSRYRLEIEAVEESATTREP